MAFLHLEPFKGREWRRWNQDLGRGWMPRRLVLGIAVVPAVIALWEGGSVALRREIVCRETRDQLDTAAGMERETNDWLMRQLMARRKTHRF